MRKKCWENYWSQNKIDIPSTVKSQPVTKNRCLYPILHLLHYSYNVQNKRFIKDLVLNAIPCVMLWKKWISWIVTYGHLVSCFPFCTASQPLSTVSQLDTTLCWPFKSKSLCKMVINMCTSQESNVLVHRFSQFYYMLAIHHNYTVRKHILFLTCAHVSHSSQMTAGHSSQRTADHDITRPEGTLFRSPQLTTKHGSRVLTLS